MITIKNVSICELKRTPIEEKKVEIVEKKGTGHPDSLADGIAEDVSKDLSKFYKEKFDKILHHNTDQVEIVGGEVDVDFGGGEVLKPIHVILSGRATNIVSGKKLPIHERAINTAKDYIRENLNDVSIDQNFTFDSKIGQGSVDLRSLYGENSIPKSNDTSFGVGYAPYSETEKLVLETNKFINSDNFQDKYPELGEDVKIMAYRDEGKITMTVAGAFIADKVPDLDHYISVKQDIVDDMRDFLVKEAEREIELHMNTADDYATEVVYLTLTGTSAEAGDDGSVGRGNRINGLITPCRPMSMEAPAGKNPLAHIGKIYNVLANMMARDIVDKTAIGEANVKILSQIGKPIDKPQVVDIDVASQEKLDKSRYEVEKIVDEKLENIRSVTDKIINGGLYF